MGSEATQPQAPAPDCLRGPTSKSGGEGKVKEPPLLGWTSFGPAPALGSQTWPCVGVLWSEVWAADPGAPPGTLIRGV